MTTLFWLAVVAIGWLVCWILNWFLIAFIEGVHICGTHKGYSVLFYAAPFITIIATIAIVWNTIFFVLLGGLTSSTASVSIFMKKKISKHIFKGFYFDI